MSTLGVLKLLNDSTKGILRVSILILNATFILESLTTRLKDIYVNNATSSVVFINYANVTMHA